MAYTNLAQSYYSKKLMESLKPKLVMANLVSSQLFDVPMPKGATIYKNSLEDISLNTYTAVSSATAALTLQSLSGNTTQSFSMSTYKQWGVMLDATDKIKSDADIVPKVIEGGADVLNAAIDTYLQTIATAGVHANNVIGSAANPVILTKSNFLDYLSFLEGALNESNAPDDGLRSLILPSQGMQIASQYFGKDVTTASADLNGMKKIRNYKGGLLSFNSYLSTNMTVSKTVPTSAGSTNMNTKCKINLTGFGTTSTDVVYDSSGSETLTGLATGDYIVMKNATTVVTAATSWTALEVMRVTSQPTTTTLSVARGQLGTSAIAIPNNAWIYNLSKSYCILAFHKKFIEFAVALNEFKRQDLGSVGHGEFMSLLSIYGGKVWTERKPLGAKMYCDFDFV